MLLVLSVVFFRSLSGGVIIEIWNTASIPPKMCTPSSTPDPLERAFLVSLPQDGPRHTAMLTRRQHSRCSPSRTYAPASSSPADSQGHVEPKTSVGGKVVVNPCGLWCASARVPYQSMEECSSGNCPTRVLTPFDGNPWLASRADVTPLQAAHRGEDVVTLCSAGSLRGYEGLDPDTSKVAMQRL